MNVRKAATLGSMVLALGALGSAPAVASCVEPGELLAANESSAWAFIASADGREGGLLVLDVNKTLLGQPSETVRVDQSRVPQGERMQVGGEYLVVLIDPDPGEAQRPANECTLVFAEAGTGAARSLRAAVNELVLPPTDAAPAESSGVPAWLILVSGIAAAAWLGLRTRPGPSAE